MKPHKHAEVIKAWADGAEVQYKGGKDNWLDVDGAPSWVEFNEYRIKPAAPKWPETAMRHDDMFGVYSACLHGRGYNSIGADTHGLNAVANAAIAHACETEQVVTKAAHDASIERLGALLRPVVDNLRLARDMRIAEAVRDACTQACADNAAPITAIAVRHIDLAAIVSGVTP